MRIALALTAGVTSLSLRRAVCGIRMIIIFEWESTHTKLTTNMMSSGFVGGGGCGSGTDRWCFE